MLSRNRKIKSAIMLHFILQFFLLKVVITFNVSTIRNSLWNNNKSGCKSYDGNAASLCVSFDDCPRMLKLIKSPDKTKAEIRLLQLITCGFDNEEPLICCPYYDIFLQTENSNQNGIKKPIPTIVFPTYVPLPPDRDRYPEVGGSRNRIPTRSTTKKPQRYVNPHKIQKHPNFHLLPPLNECGRTTMFTGNRIIGGNDSMRGSHPWIVRIGHTHMRNDELEFICGGTIINSRYILTASHCITAQPQWKLSTVRVGEHNSDKDEDCEDFDDTHIPCSTFEDFDISDENVISHPNYKILNMGIDDIALIRLDHPINFTDYIVSPVCLPFWEYYNLGDKYSSANISQFDTKKGTVSGWGINNWSDSESMTVLQELLVPIVSNSDCQMKFDDSKTKATVTERQMCAGGATGRDACSGDSGGPITFIDRIKIDKKFIQKTFQLGIVSFGPRHCARGGVPTIFTRISAYTKWILDNIKP